MVVAYHVHSILLILSPKKREWLIDHRHTMEEYILVCCSIDELKLEGNRGLDVILLHRLASCINVAMESGKYGPRGLKEREKQIRVLCKSLKVVVRPPWELQLI